MASKCCFPCSAVTWYSCVCGLERDERGGTCGNVVLMLKHGGERGENVNERRRALLNV